MVSLKNSLFLIVASIAFSLSGFSQIDKTKGVRDSTLVIKLVDVQGEYERAVSKIPLMLQRYADSTLLHSLEAELERNSEELGTAILDADEILSGYMSSSQITNFQIRLNRSRINLEDLSVKITDIVADIEKSLSLLERLKSKWNAVLEETNSDTLFISLLPQVQEVLALTGSAEKNLQYQLSRLLAIHVTINQNQNDITQYSERVENAKSLSFERLFQRDSVYLWTALKKDTLKKDTVTTSFSGSLARKTTESLKYLNMKSTMLVWLLVLGVGLYLVMFILQRSQKLSARDSESSTESLAIKYPIASAIITVLLITILSLTNRPDLVTKLLVLAFAFPVLIFASDKTVRNRWIFWVIIVADAILVIGDLDALPAQGQHILIMLLNLIAITVLYWMYRSPDKYLTDIGSTTTRFIKSFLVPVYFYLSVVTLLLYIVGYRSLAELVLKGIVQSLYFGPVVLLCYEVILGFIATLSKTRILSDSHIVSRYLPFIFKLIRLGAFYLWIRTLVVAFSVKEFFDNVAMGLWELGGDFGEFHVTFGGVVGTVLVILFSFVISNFIKVLLEDEILSRLDVPRGVPMAIGVLAKYFVIVLGFFLAIASTGFDLTKMSIIAGALGVGVGFGLQNLVSNFISGMILIFERPILVGDIIEADGHEGTVSEIGIRATKIITYAGAEVIIPNAILTSNNVSNWTLTNRKRRFVFEVRTHGKANPAEVITILSELATSHIHVIKDPQPFVIFEGQKEQALIFKLYYWQVGEILITRSELNTQIYNALEALGVELTIPVIEIRK